MKPRTAGKLKPPSLREPGGLKPANEAAAFRRPQNYKFQKAPNLRKKIVFKTKITHLPLIGDGGGGRRLV